MEENNVNVNTEQTTEETDKSAAFTDEQMVIINQMIQSESDRRTNQALKKERAKHQKELSLANLDGVEREKAEAANRIAELEEQLKAFTIEKNKSELKSVLSSRGLSAEFADYLAIGEDVAENQRTVDAIDKLFKAAVKMEVEKRIAATGATPKGSNFANSEVSLETFRKMSLAEQAALYNSNPELYKKLTNN